MAKLSPHPAIKNYPKPYNKVYKKLHKEYYQEKLLKTPVDVFNENLLPEKVEVDLSQWYFTHSKPPRGEGAWAFQIKGKTEFFGGKYTDAKKKAMAAAKKANVGRIFLMP